MLVEAEENVCVELLAPLSVRNADPVQNPTIGGDRASLPGQACPRKTPPNAYGTLIGGSGGRLRPINTREHVQRHSPYHHYTSHLLLFYLRWSL